MSLFLSWIDITVSTIGDLLWYLAVAPPPGAGPGEPVRLPIDDGPKKTERPPATATPNKPIITEEPKTKPESGDQSTKTQSSKTDLPPPPEVLPVEKSTPSMFALIIGINDYASPKIADLRGCVPDADDMLLFLTTTLSVPPANITNLRNSEATREAIENAIAALGNNKRIKHNDPILIFYAGHGGEAPSPQGWPGDGQVQMLIPHDFVPEATGDKKRGQGVLDVKLSHLLQQLAEKKGDNISVIFDSCHSGSGTRDDENDPSFSIRGVELDPKTYKIAPNILDDLPGERASSIAKGFEKSGLLSHVLLAACKKGQTAKERAGRGAFTTELMKILREEGVDMLTYKDIVLRFPDLPLQNPQCEGVNQSRTLFNSSVISKRQIYHVTCNKAGTYLLEAGDAHGIALEAHFAIYSDRRLKQLLGNVVAQTAAAFQTVLVPAPGQAPFTFEAQAFAVQTRVGKGEDVKLLMPLDARLIPVLTKIKDEMQRNEADKRAISLVDTDSANPDLTISIGKENGKSVANFDVNDTTCRKYGLTRMPYTADLDPKELYPVLRSAADFYWNLNRSSNQSIIAPKIKFSAFRLAESGEFNDDFEAVLMPDKQVGDLNVEGMITIYVDDEGDYGFSIKNTSAIPLFVSLFYFDMSDLSVAAYYKPATAKDGDADPSIPAGGELTIGYGDSGTAPYTYTLRPNQATDVGYLKLFLSTKYVDFSNVEQDTPFKQERASGESKAKTRLIWDTMKIAVVQKTRT